MMFRNITLGIIAALAFSFVGGCKSSIYSPDTKEMRVKLNDYKTANDLFYGSDHYEDGKFQKIGYVLFSEKKYEIIYYEFYWNISSSDSSWHQTQKLLIFDGGEYIKEYIVRVTPVNITIEGASTVRIIDEDSDVFDVDFSQGLPDLISIY